VDRVERRVAVALPSGTRRTEGFLSQEVAKKAEEMRGGSPRRAKKKPVGRRGSTASRYMRKPHGGKPPLRHQNVGRQDNIVAKDVVKGQQGEGVERRGTVGARGKTVGLTLQGDGPQKKKGDGGGWGRKSGGGRKRSDVAQEKNALDQDLRKKGISWAREEKGGERAGKDQRNEKQDGQVRETTRIPCELFWGKWEPRQERGR